MLAGYLKCQVAKLPKSAHLVKYLLPVMAGAQITVP
jgi:hypothetical protein